VSGTEPKPEPHPIEARSFEIMAAEVDLGRWPEGQRQLVARMVHATADESFCTTTLIGARAVPAALAALAERRPVVCDSAMVVAGSAAAGRLAPLACYLPEVSEAPAGRTRSAAAIDLAVTRHPEGSLWVFGNAPTALVTLLEHYFEGRVRPAAVIGLTVGYVGASESKAALWSSPLREVSITNSGRRGGSAPAAACLNALARLALSGWHQAEWAQGAP